MSREAAPVSDQGLRNGRTAGRLFVIIFIVAAGLAALTVWLVSSGQGAQGDIGRPLQIVITALVINGGLICVLMGLVGTRIPAVLRSREEGSRLHLRYMSLFALAAAVPAVIIALFFGLLVTRGIDGWFSAKMQTMVNSYAAIAQQVGDIEQESLGGDISATSIDLNRYIDVLHRSRETFEQQILKPQMAQRGFISIRVIDEQGQVLAEAETAHAKPYVPPNQRAYIDANAAVGPQCQSPSPSQDCTLPDTIDEKTDVAQVLFPLSGPNHPYVLVEAPYPPGLYTRLKVSADAVHQYRDMQVVRGKLQALFMWSYFETVLLVVLGAIWLGMRVANSISDPVARLIHAANKVAGGDLKARVPTDSSLQELNALSHSFNQMIDDLDRQTSALVTAGKDAENRRNFIETVLSGVSAGVIGLDPAGRISAFNNQALRLLDISEDQARGKALADVAPELLDVAQRAAETGSGAEAELNVLRGNLTRRLRVRAGGDAHAGLVLTFDDMTRLVAAQRNAAWRDVARRIAHEIKNPLTPIQLSAERLRRKYRAEITSDVDIFDRCTDTIIRQVGDIRTMVDEFSSFARMPAPRITTCDGPELLREAVFARRVANPEIEITLTEDMKGEPLIHCDERMIGQALTNILKNAAEAVQARAQGETGFAGKIVARIRRQDELVIFEVEDNGVGLPEEGRDRLIEPYVTTREKGTGLGLAIVGRILEDHGGSLSLTDAKDVGGALVVMVLPQDEQPRFGETQSPIQTEHV